MILISVTAINNKWAYAVDAFLTCLDHKQNLINFTF